MNVESRLAKLEDLGRQIQCQGKITTVDEMVEKINRLTSSDLKNVLEKVITGNVVTKVLAQDCHLWLCKVKENHLVMLNFGFVIMA